MKRCTESARVVAHVVVGCEDIFELRPEREHRRDVLVELSVDREDGNGGRGQRLGLVPFGHVGHEARLAGVGTDVEHTERLDVGGGRRPLRKLPDLAQLSVGDRRRSEAVRRPSMGEKDFPASVVEAT